MKEKKLTFKVSEGLVIQDIVYITLKSCGSPRKVNT